ncbi:hypothetical protein M427DRAFT_44163 [Gonapodya prolifera JEL478]|uniref:NAD(P)-binding protein n=1 Tax=Gonapodya prolifera (strain JEL478) TaxID=1344416 RepID=A0A139AGR8_GONPJ|nr:hypothetical protein M427DRAFT_44163 [Gonapodya prolifera JEL478]|eukprot:KXS16022.1 hypothetical protein M427DRAFT_44163 [Gonapodya prolifera JEL478]
MKKDTYDKNIIPGATTKVAGMCSEGIKIEGKRGIVTRASKGISRAPAELLVKDGASVAICGRNKANLDGAVTGAVLDVSDGAALKQWIDSVATEFGGLDFVVASVSALEIAPTIDAWKKASECQLLRHGTSTLVQVFRCELRSISSVSGGEVDFTAGAPYGRTHSLHVLHGVDAKSGLKGAPVRFNTVSPGNTYFDGGAWQNIERENPEFFKTVLAHNHRGGRGCVGIFFPKASQHNQLPYQGACQRRRKWAMR